MDERTEALTASSGDPGRDRRKGRRSDSTSDTTRILAFSDGVLAIAITLLVLEIHVPDAADAARAGGLLRALAEQWPSYLAYLAAFATIGAVWLNHHAAFRLIARADRTVLGWNLLLLLAASFIPFPTALVALHLAGGIWSDSARVATASYAVVGIACCLPWVAMYGHLARHPRLLRAPYSPADVRAEMRRGWIGVGGYAAAVLIAIVAPIVATALFLLGSVYHAATASAPTHGEVDDRAAVPADGP